MFENKPNRKIKNMDRTGIRHVEKSEYYFRRILQAGTGNLPNP
jgi:hypothetical protein